MTNPNKTSVTIILDRSGSMNDCRSDTIGGYNTFIEGQKQNPGECEISLIQFNDRSEFVYKSKPVNEAPNLDHTTFVPHGGTALLDAIGKAIIEKGKELEALSEDERPSKVIMVIITDGDENTSKEFTKEKIAALIKQQTDVYSWVFTFLAANQDAIATAKTYSIAADNSLNFSSTKSGGAARAFAAASSYVGRTRCGSASKGYTVDERESNS